MLTIPLWLWICLISYSVSFDVYDHCPDWEQFPQKDPLWGPFLATDLGFSNSWQPLMCSSFLILSRTWYKWNHIVSNLLKLTFFSQPNSRDSFKFWYILILLFLFSYYVGNHFCFIRFAFTSSHTFTVFPPVLRFFSCHSGSLPACLKYIL